MTTESYGAYIPDVPPKLWFWTQGLGHYQMGSDYGHTNSKGFFGFHHVFLTISGQGSYRWRNRRFTDQPHTLTIMNYVSNWMNWRTAHEKWDFYWMIIKGVGPIEWMRQFNISLPIVSKPIQNEQIPDLVNRFDRAIKDMNRDHLNNQVEVQRDCFILYTNLIQAAQNTVVKSSQIPTIYGKNLLEEIDQYLQRPDPMPDRLTELAKNINASPEHISRVLKTSLGMSSKEYFLRFRIRQAQRLLRETTLSIGEIGDRLGYSDPQYFSRLFRYRTGISAFAYRKHGRIL